MMAVADNAGRLLKPGLFVEVELPVGTASSVVRVPKSAVQTDSGETFVFVQHEPGDLREDTDSRRSRGDRNCGGGRGSARR